MWDTEAKLTFKENVFWAKLDLFQALKFQKKIKVSPLTPAKALLWTHCEVHSAAPHIPSSIKHAFGFLLTFPQIHYKP